MNTQHSFRYDINALRALAVISVLLFHFESSFLPGGFIGVDIFFVVSGYLMTSIILRGLFNSDTAGGGFSIWRFYKMRARRIIPALIALCFICLIWGFCNFNNDDYARLGRHIRDSLLFTSNYTYLRGVNDYFTADPSKFVLLHTWSLSVEWQFYIIYPIILIIIKKLFHSLNWIKATIAFLFILSLTASLIIGHYNPQADYFLLYGRAYEMLMGAFAYLYRDRCDRRTKRQKSLIAASGLILIAFSIIWLNQNFVWPGAWALLPTFGTLLILLANQQYAVYRFWPIQILGKISYSLYLVHWPILAIANIHQIKLNIAELSVLSLTAASLLYITIERKRDYKYKCIAAYVLCLILAIMYRYNSYNINSLRTNSPWDQLTIFNFFGGDSASLKYLDHKIQATENFSLIIYGDSYARQYIPLLNAYGVKTANLALNGCFSTQQYASTFDHDKCMTKYDNLMQQIKQNQTKIIVWAQYWSAYGKDGTILKRLSSQKISHKEYIDNLSREIQTVINQLHADQTLILIAQPHYPSIDIFHCLNAKANKLLFLSGSCTAADEQDSNLEIHQYNVMLTDIVKRNPHKAAIFYPDNSLCKNRICALIENGMPRYTDVGHLSILGAAKVVPELIKELKNLPGINSNQD